MNYCNMDMDCEVIYLENVYSRLYSQPQPDDLTHAESLMPGRYRRC